MLTQKAEVHNIAGGHGTIELHKPYGEDVHYGIMNINGDYPGEGTVAKNTNRTEYINVLSGEIMVTLNGENFTLRRGEAILINDGDTYKISGNADVIVFINDKENPNTLVEKEM